MSKCQNKNRLGKFTLLFVFISALFNACKKDKIDSIGGEPKVPDTTEIRSYFTDTLQTTVEENKEVFVAYTVKGHFFYVMQFVSGNNYRLTKCTRELDTVYSKILDLGPGKLIQIKGDISEDGFYALTATIHYGAFSGPSINAFTLTNTYYDSTCSKLTQANQYNYEQDFKPEGALWQNNTTELKKFNYAGKEIWSKQFSGNYFSGNAMEWATNGNLYLLTSVQYPFRFKLNTTLSQAYPYYDRILDSNSCTIYALNRNGTVLKKREIAGIYQGDGGFEPNLTLSSGHLWVNNRDGLYTLDFNLNILSNAKPIINSCYNFFASVVSNPFVSRALVSGFMAYSSPNQRNQYHVFLNGLLEENPRQNLNLVPVYVAMNKLGEAYALSLMNQVSKYDFKGDLMYSKQLNPLFFMFTLSKNNCISDANNKFYRFAQENNLIKVYKLDENGNF